MAWNPSKEVAAARDIGKKFKQSQVIILMIDHDKGTLQCASYGETKALCAKAKRLADKAYDAVMENYVP